jgi:hypothetical protein
MGHSLCLVMVVAILSSNQFRFVSLFLPLSISPSFSIWISLSQGLNACMVFFIMSLLSFNLTILIFQSLYVFRIVSLQEFYIIVKPFTQKFDTITWKGCRGSKVLTYMCDSSFLSLWISFFFKISVKIFLS